MIDFGFSGVIYIVIDIFVKSRSYSKKALARVAGAPGGCWFMKKPEVEHLCSGSH
jgi:hypothetical protein